MPAFKCSWNDLQRSSRERQSNDPKTSRAAPFPSQLLLKWIETRLFWTDWRCDGIHGSNSQFQLRIKEPVNAHGNSLDTGNEYSSLPGVCHPNITNRPITSHFIVQETLKATTVAVSYDLFWSMTLTLEFFSHGCFYCGKWPIKTHVSGQISSVNVEHICDSVCERLFFSLFHLIRSNEAWTILKCDFSVLVSLYTFILHREAECVQTTSSFTMKESNTRGSSSVGVIRTSGQKRPLEKINVNVIQRTRSLQLDLISDPDAFPFCPASDLE